LELLGHRRLVGLVSECEIAGNGFLRIDVMDTEGKFTVTQYYSPSSVYCLTPTTEAAVHAEVEMRKARPALNPYGSDDFPDLGSPDDEDENDEGDTPCDSDVPF
jgi:hypothetical protein